MAGETILVIEDEEDILEVLRYNLARAGFKVATAADGLKGLKAAQTNPPDLILLDLMLPGMDGLDVCRELKRGAKTGSVAIMMVTAKGEETDIVTGLELGADDYITKPFSPKVVVARARAVLRRRKVAAPASDQVLKVHDLTIDPGRHEVLCGKRAVELTATEFRLLHFLARRPGWVFTREQIVDGVKGADYPVTDRSVDVQMVGLRRKLGSWADVVDTVRGVGYRFKDKE